MRIPRQLSSRVQLQNFNRHRILRHSSKRHRVLSIEK
jgi:hypothetical protein